MLFPLIHQGQEESAPPPPPDEPKVTNPVSKDPRYMKYFKLVQVVGINPLRKQAYSNILKILPPKKKKNENFQIKILIFFIILLKT